MLAFAANSLLCRAALAGGHADAASFTTLRLAGGAVALGAPGAGARARGALLRRPRGARPWPSSPTRSPFSLAYLRVPAGTGALLLFAAVQLTMIGAGLRAGERPRALEWAGLGVSLVGLVLLTRPGLAQPDPPERRADARPRASAWGLYSLRGRGVADPVAANAAASPAPFPWRSRRAPASRSSPRRASRSRGSRSPSLSGALTSGLGYAIWYAALRGLSATRAADRAALGPAARGGARPS